MDILAPESVLRSIFHEATGRIDHEDPSSRLGVLLIEDNDAGGDGCAVEQIGGQSDDGLDEAALDERFPNSRFGAPEEHSVRKDHCGLAGALERLEHV